MKTNKITILIGLLCILISTALAVDDGQIQIESGDVPSNWIACQDSTNYYSAQTFTWNYTFAFLGVNVFINNVSDPGTDVLWFEWRDSPTGTLIAKTENKTLSSLSPGWYQFAFPDYILMPAGVYSVNANSDARLNCAGRTTYVGSMTNISNPYAEGQYWDGAIGFVPNADVEIDIGYESLGCNPSWYCSQFTECFTKPYNHKDCLVVSDANLCVDTFTGDLSAYSQTCTVTSKGGNVIQTTSASKQTTIGVNPIEQLILNLRNWLFNLLGVKA